MALVLDEQQLMLERSAREFIDEQSPISALRALRDQGSAEGFVPALWKQFGEMGFAGVLVPEAHGGLGLGQVEAGIVMAALGHTLGASPFWSTSVVGASALRLAGTPEQQAQWLPRIAQAETILALAIDEGAKHRPGRIETVVTEAGEGRYTLDGSKTFVVDGHVAERLIVVARDAKDPTALSLWLVDPKAAGVSVERTVYADAHNAARVSFKKVTLQAADALGGAAAIGRAASLLAALLDIGRAAAAAELVGVADEVFGRTVAYLKERKQFGQFIGEFQALQHRAAHLHTEIEITRAAVLCAAQQLDLAQHEGRLFADATGTEAGALQGGDRASGVSRDVSIAKARAGASTTLAVQEGVQMHGGMGMTEDLDFGLFMKRARVLQELLGDSDFHGDRFARLNGY